tara:strand:+ start:105 stop:503 length:399 start_codon:yes stop_codon:yes gene_type:complete
MSKETDSMGRPRSKNDMELQQIEDDRAARNERYAEQQRIASGNAALNELDWHKFMSPYDRQIGGNHYIDFQISPFEFIERNKLSYGAGNVIKYICRWKKKGFITDLEKAKHYIELLIELEKQCFVDLADGDQ